MSDLAAVKDGLVIYDYLSFRSAARKRSAPETEIAAYRSSARAKLSPEAQAETDVLGMTTEAVKGLDAAGLAAVKHLGGKFLRDEGNPDNSADLIVLLQYENFLKMSLCIETGPTCSDTENNLEEKRKIFGLDAGQEAAAPEAQDQALNWLKIAVLLGYEPAAKVIEEIVDKDEIVGDIDHPISVRAALLLVELGRREPASLVEFVHRHADLASSSVLVDIYNYINNNFARFKREELQGLFQFLYERLEGAFQPEKALLAAYVDTFKPESESVNGLKFYSETIKRHQDGSLMSGMLAEKATVPIPGGEPAEFRRGKTLIFYPNGQLRSYRGVDGGLVGFQFISPTAP